ncbi:NADPH2:quinone reductase [Nakamurella sp. UYEF19]|uniref:quinone oxidoreductase family protein n=1 Tax=Nakamurella sp. UYEF19 TaxID=1756392 RepID=UPI003393F369
MKAVRVQFVGSPEVLELQEVEPPRPGVGEVAIDVAYAGVGLVDTRFRDGTFEIATPFIPGIEVSGYVRSVGAGAGADRFQAGRPVAALLNDFGRAPGGGGYAGIVVARADLVVPLADGVDLARAAGALVNGTTAWIALHDLARIAPSESLLVLGATGGLGTAVVRLAVAAGVRQIIGVVSSEEKRRKAIAAGCTDTILRSQWGGDLQRITEGQRVDVVVDPVGGEARHAALQALAPFGRLVVLGNASGQDVPVSTDSLWHRTITMTGLSLGGIAHTHPGLLARAASAALGVLAADSAPAPTIRPLAEAADVHRELESGAAPTKTVLDLGSFRPGFLPA